MSNSYCGFVVTLDELTDAQADWAELLIQAVSDLDQGTDPEEKTKRQKEIATCARAVYDGSSMPQMEIAGLNLHIWSEEFASVDIAANLIQAILRKFDRDDIVWFDWANWDDNRTLDGAFSGGAVAISKEAQSWMNTETVGQHLMGELRDFRRKKKTPLKLGKGIAG